MGSVFVNQSMKIRDQMIEKCYICPHCHKLFIFKKKGYVTLSCPHCNTWRVSWRVQWVIKQKWLEKGKLDDIKNLLQWNEPNIIYRGSLKDLVKAIAFYEKTNITDEDIPIAVK